LLPQLSSGDATGSVCTNAELTLAPPVLLISSSSLFCSWSASAFSVVATRNATVNAVFFSCKA